MDNDKLALGPLLGLYGIWVGLAGLAALTALQLHTTLVFIGSLVIANPALRPSGWTPQTVNALSSFLFLVLGVLWLGLVMFGESYLREGYQRHELSRRAIGLGAGLLFAYAASYLLLLILA